MCCPFSSSCKFCVVQFPPKLLAQAKTMSIDCPATPRRRQTMTSTPSRPKPVHVCKAPQATVCSTTANTYTLAKLEPNCAHRATDEAALSIREVDHMPVSLKITTGRESKESASGPHGWLSHDCTTVTPTLATLESLSPCKGPCTPHISM